MRNKQWKNEQWKEDNERTMRIGTGNNKSISFPLEATVLEKIQYYSPLNSYFDVAYIDIYYQNKKGIVGLHCINEQ